MLDICDEIFGQSCYWMEDGIMYFHEAEYTCQAKDGHLLELENDAEYELIAEILNTGSKVIISYFLI